MSNEDAVVVTREGFLKLEEELKELKGEKRSELAARLKLAISFGDLKENSEYHSAKEDQAFLETRIKTLEKMLTHAKVVDAEKLDLTQVSIGSTVLLKDIEFGDCIEYTLVSPAESDVAENKLSYESPLGKELLGKKAGEILRVEAPMGIVEYELLEIRLK